jgi:hypothetical protein
VIVKCPILGHARRCRSAIMGTVHLCPLRRESICVNRPGVRICIRCVRARRSRCRAAGVAPFLSLSLSQNSEFVFRRFRNRHGSVLPASEHSMPRIGDSISQCERGIHSHFGDVRKAACNSSRASLERPHSQSLQIVQS